MKDIRKKIIELFREGYCTPQISKIAQKIKEPSTTIHYNIKKLEEEGIIKTYKAVFNHKLIDEGFCSFVLINLSHSEYGDPEKIAKMLSEQKEVESIDICTGDWEIIIKVRTKDQEGYYQFIKKVLSRPGIERIKSLTSLKQIENYFVKLSD